VTPKETLHFKGQELKKIGPQKNKLEVLIQAQSETISAVDKQLKLLPTIRHQTVILRRRFIREHKLLRERINVLEKDILDLAHQDLDPTQGTLKIRGRRDRLKTPSLEPLPKTCGDTGCSHQTRPNQKYCRCCVLGVGLASKLGCETLMRGTKQ